MCCLYKDSTKKSCPGDHNCHIFSYFTSEMGLSILCNHEKSTLAKHFFSPLNHLLMFHTKNTYEHKWELGITLRHVLNKVHEPTAKKAC